VLLHGIHDAAQSFRGTLDDLFECGDALEEMLVERQISFVLVILDFILFERGQSGEYEELVLANSRSSSLKALQVWQSILGAD
jgi:hypothetical protein